MCSEILSAHTALGGGLSQSIYGKFQGRDNSCTSGEAASAGIENSPRVTKGLSQFPKNGLAGVVK